MKKLSFLFIFLLVFSYSSYAQYPNYLYGIISWYGSEYDGSVTASGEVFDSTELTGAHQSLPFGTIVEVENLANGNTVTIEINDRGPYVENRILDVSEAAAEILEFKSAGTTYSKVTILEIGEGEVSDDNLLDAMEMREDEGVYDNPEETNTFVSNIVTQSVVITNYVFVTNTDFGYNETVVERDVNSTRFNVDEDFNPEDQFIIEEPLDDPVIPVDDYIWTPEVDNFYIDKPVSETNYSSNVVDLGIPDRTPPVMETNSQDPVNSTNQRPPQDRETDTHINTNSVNPQARTNTQFINTNERPPRQNQTTNRADDNLNIGPERVTPETIISDQAALDLEDLYIQNEAYEEIEIDFPSEKPVIITNYITILQTNIIDSFYTNTIVQTNVVDNFVTNRIFNTNSVTTTDQSPVAMDADGYSYAVQVGAFKKESNALALYASLSDAGYPVFTTETYVGSQKYIRVRVGYYGSMNELYDIIDELEDYNLPSLVVKVQLSSN